MTLHLDLRTVCALTGGGLIAGGIAVALGALVTQLAWALPAAELLGRPGTTTALLLVGPGLILLRLAHTRRPERHALVPAPAQPIRRAA